MPNSTKEYQAQRLTRTNQRTAPIAMPAGLSILGVYFAHAMILTVKTSGNQDAAPVNYVLIIVAPGETAPDGASLIGSVDWTANLDVNATCQVYLKANA